ncbi:hypothetical protein ACPXCX_50680, partial [Streptomyces sp. DT225]
MVLILSWFSGAFPTVEEVTGGFPGTFEGGVGVVVFVEVACVGVCVGAGVGVDVDETGVDGVGVVDGTGVAVGRPFGT